MIKDLYCSFLINIILVGNHKQLCISQCAESKDKEAAINNELKNNETYLDEDQIKGKKFQQKLEDLDQKINNKSKNNYRSILIDKAILYIKK
ncbi:hypothetical protein H8356DRAFT_1431866 [Neocallimastix lanati (nom. inval.)]|nr:hypothetical protein H8356DRAFT_1431866 [Neocallimastix sp. JGI-2020a]